MALPLTWQLQNETPLRRWFCDRLPRVQQVPGVAPASVRPVVPRGRPDTLPPWLIGGAFDWRLRLGLEVPSEPAATTAYVGWCLLRDALEPPMDRMLRSVAAEGAADDFEDPVTGLLRHARSHGAGQVPPSDRDERVLAKVAVALARFESLYRGGVRHDEPLLELGSAPSVSQLVGSCPTRAAEELARLTALARRGVAPLFPADLIETNPDFTALGIPADGDLVVDGLLLELKVVSRPRVQPEWLWQLLGYTFLDDGRRGIDRVGLYLARHGRLQVWSVEELLSALASGVTSRDVLGREFVDVATGRWPDGEPR